MEEMGADEAIAQRSSGLPFAGSCDGPAAATAAVDDATLVAGDEASGRYRASSGEAVLFGESKVRDGFEGSRGEPGDATDLLIVRILG